MNSIQSDYTDKYNYYNKILELDISVNNDWKKDIIIKDIDYVLQLITQSALSKSHSVRV